jgi:hypothetical protein
MYDFKRTLMGSHIKSSGCDIVIQSEIISRLAPDDMREYGYTVYHESRIITGTI